MISITMTRFNIWARLRRLSAWIDEKLFPVAATAQERKAREMQAIEKCAGIVQKQIADCKRLKDCYDAHDAIIDFRNIWGGTVQVNGWYDSLLLALRNKETEIISKL